MKGIGCASNSIKNFLIKYDYINYVVISFLFLVSCFYFAAIYAVMAYIIIVSIFSDIENIIKYYLFILPFDALFVIDYGVLKYLIRFFKLALVLVIFVKFSLLCIKKKERFSYPCMALFVFYLFFVFSPIHSLNSVFDFATIAPELMLILVVLSNKKIKNLPEFVKILAIAIIVSSLFGLLKDYSPRLQEVVANNYRGNTSILRFQGLTTQPNTLAALCAVCFSLFLIVKFYNKISWYNFAIYSVCLITICVTTFSRNYLIAMSLAIYIFAIILLFKIDNKKLKISLLVSINFVAVALVVFAAVKILNSEIFSHQDGFYLLTKEEQKAILAGKQFYDPGRFGLWKLYYKDITSSFGVLLFGHGVGSLAIGKMSAHNIVLWGIWQIGLIGVLIYTAIVATLILTYKKCKRINYIVSLVYIVPVLFGFLFDYNPFGKIVWVVLIILIRFIQACEFNRKLTFKKV